MTDVPALLQQEAERQQRTLSLIASENHSSRAVRAAAGSLLADKYAEGYPGKRYYAGNGVADQIENAAIAAAGQAFATDYHVNVQPYAGSVANLAVYAGLLQPGDTVLALSLADGGHLTHGHAVSFTSRIYRFDHYGVDPESCLIDCDAVLEHAKRIRPKLIVAGGSAYPMLIDFAAFGRIAREVGAWFMVDMAHFAGLVAGGAYPTPFGIADVVTSTTHKTLRGPRGAVIFCRPEFARAVDRAVFPGLQGGPNLPSIAAKAIAFQEATTPAFAAYCRQVVANARALAFRMQRHGFRLVADGTDTHLLLLDLRPGALRGREASILLEEAGIICNMNAVPNDDQPPSNPSGLRFGTPAVTTRGMKEKEMELLGDAIAGVLRGNGVAEAAATVRVLAGKFRLPA